MRRVRAVASEPPPHLFVTPRRRRVQAVADCQVLSSIAAMAGGSSSADALFVPPLMPNPALAGFMSSSSAMPFNHFSTTLIPKEESVMGGLYMTKDEEMDLLAIETELSSGSASCHLEGLLSFADMDNNCKDQKHVMK